MAVPDAPVREGSRWRWQRPSSEEVAEWWKGVPLDKDMEDERDKFVSGVVLIPATEKVKKQVEQNGRVGTVDQYEMTFTPYVRVDTRISYFRALAAKRNQIAVIEAVQVPRIGEGSAANLNLPDGFWWYLVPTGANTEVRYLCCTMRVALYEPDAYFDGPSPRPSREGIATKQVAISSGQGTDPNAIAKAETGGIGRALGMAGILVVGTGIATAEDLLEVTQSATETPTLPEAGAQPEMTPEQVAERLLHLSAQMREQVPGRWQEFSAWWQSRSEAEGWATITDAPLEVRRGVVRRMERSIEAGDVPPVSPPSSPDDSSQGELPAELVADTDGGE